MLRGDRTLAVHVERVNVVGGLAGGIVDTVERSERSVEDEDCGGARHDVVTQQRELVPGEAEDAALKVLLRGCMHAVRGRAGAGGRAGGSPGMCRAVRRR